MKALALLALIWFPFAETPQPAPTLRGNIIAVPIAPSPVEPDRRCSLPGEMQQCRDYCGRIGGIVPKGSPWDPFAPISLSSHYTPYLAVRSCEVKTVGGQLSLVCECFSPGNEA